MPEMIDSMGMKAAVNALPEQLSAALALAQAVPNPAGSRPIANVIMFGMGGSGVAGDIVSALASPLMQVPVTVAKSYECPAFVGPSTLAIAVSFSGNTEETLEAVTAAHDAGASIVAVTSGGHLADLARQWNVPLYEVDGTIPMPRAAVGAIAVMPLVALERAGLLNDVADWVEAGVTQLRTRQQMQSSSDLDELVRAISVGEKIPIFYGGGALGAVVAGRAKAQVNENVKIPAYASVMPELCHNELAGWNLVGPPDHSPLAVVALRHDFEHAQMHRRYDFTQSVLGVLGVPGGGSLSVPYYALRAAGEGPLAQLFDLIFQVDVLSLRIAAAAQRDPGPIPLLTELKEYLACD